MIIPAPPELPAGSHSVWSDSLSFSPNPNPLIFQGPIRGLAKFLLHKISLCRPLCLLLRLCSRVVRASFGTALLTSAKWAPEQGNGARAAVGLGCDGRLGSWEMGVRRSQNNGDRARGVTTDSSSSKEEDRHTGRPDDVHPTHSTSRSARRLRAPASSSERRIPHAQGRHFVRLGVLRASQSPRGARPVADSPSWF